MFGLCSHWAGDLGSLSWSLAHGVMEESLWAVRCGLLYLHRQEVFRTGTTVSEKHCGLRHLSVTPGHGALWRVPGGHLGRAWGYHKGTGSERDTDPWKKAKQCSWCLGSWKCGEPISSASLYQGEQLDGVWLVPMEGECQEEARQGTPIR